jgi:mRNA-degrading endonuclease toxin of MazEF toxin-antitoxin module
VSDADRPVYERGDVVVGLDPFKGEDAARPWLVVTNHEGEPFHADQYIVLTLTTKSWHDGLVAVESEDWVRGGTPRESRIAPWSVQSIDHGDIDYWQGRLRPERVEAAVDALRERLSN